MSHVVQINPKISPWSNKTRPLPEKAQFVSAYYYLEALINEADGFVVSFFVSQHSNEFVLWSLISNEGVIRYWDPIAVQQKRGIIKFREVVSQVAIGDALSSAKRMIQIYQKSMTGFAGLGSQVA